MYSYTEDKCQICLMQVDIEKGIFLDKNGICVFCKTHVSDDRDWKYLQNTYSQKLSSYKGKNKGGDIVVMLSGGKDSAYMAWDLKINHGLNVVAVTIDNTFDYPESFSNARSIAEKLDIPHEIISPPKELIREFYKFLITSPEIMDEGFGQICLYCGKYLLDTAVDYALQHNIPSVAVGYNPEQLFGMGKTLDIESSKRKINAQKRIRQNLEQLFELADSVAQKKCLDANIPPITYENQANCEIIYPFMYMPYKPLEIMELVKNELQWEPIRGFSPSKYIASGCKILKLMAELARINNTPSYMEHEFSKQVRSGNLSKDALESFYSDILEEPEFFTEILKELEIEQSLDDIAKTTKK